MVVADPLAVTTAVARLPAAAVAATIQPAAAVGEAVVAAQPAAEVVEAAVAVAVVAAAPPAAAAQPALEFRAAGHNLCRVIAAGSRRDRGHPPNGTEAAALSNIAPPVSLPCRPHDRV
jgi:hypothetical protein